MLGRLSSPQITFVATYCETLFMWRQYGELNFNDGKVDKLSQPAAERNIKNKDENSGCEALPFRTKKGKYFRMSNSDLILTPCLDEYKEPG